MQNKFNIDIFKIDEEKGLAKRGKEGPGGQLVRISACSRLPWGMPLSCLAQSASFTNPWTHAGMVLMFSD